MRHDLRPGLRRSAQRRAVASVARVRTRAPVADLAGVSVHGSVEGGQRQMLPKTQGQRRDEVQVRRRVPGETIVARKKQEEAGPIE